MRKLFVSVAALAVFSLAGVAKAGTFTFNAPVTAGNTNTTTNKVSAGSNYAGGTNQFDLDHHDAYTWRISGLNVPAGQTITSASLTFYNMNNWDNTANTLFVHLLDSSSTFASASGLRSATVNGVTSYVDASGSPVNDISDYFAASNALVANGTGNTLLGTYSDTNGTSTIQSAVTFNFSAAQLAALSQYIANGGDIAFGFDPDCHYFNNGITFSYTTNPTATPEPATMTLLGTGLAGLYYRRRRQQKQQA